MGMREQGCWSRWWSCKGGGTTYTVELHVQAAGVAHGLALRVAAPQRGGGGLAVGTGEAHSAGSGLQYRRQTLQVQVKGRRCCFCLTGRECCRAGPPLCGWLEQVIIILCEHLRPARGQGLPSPGRSWGGWGGEMYALGEE